MIAERPLLLDVTRLVARSWSRRLSTGIDRVAYAYLRRFAARAQAVVQHRGFVRVLDRRHSDDLFDLLLGRDESFRRQVTALTARALMTGSPAAALRGATYLNVNHTDFDLESHQRWIRMAGLRSAYLLHDLIPITHGEHCSAHAVRRHRGRVLGALQHGSGIVVSTAAVAQDLKAFARSQRLPVPPLLVAPIAGNAMTPRVPNGEPGGYFVCLGTIESRKNHRLLLDVWSGLVARLGSAAPRLVIVGQWGYGSEPVRRRLDSDLALRGHVTMYQRHDDAGVARLLAGARAVVMPTLAEGYGLPMVEALHAGVPVIASDLPCLREVGQGIPTFLPTDNAAVWQAAIARFAPGAPEFDRQRAAMHRFRAPTWDRHFEHLEEWLPQLHPMSEFRASTGSPDALRPALVPAE
ncbi:glycosyltransferase [Novosphingobium sp. 9]|uniref:glycosyltransferase n=1 Tax=Novosphingobium sp. 9 TaxID=2025349 RepID=UPI0021B5E17F|nr:glycosyltransferase [Novosphingobium sp. 9]